MHNTEARFATLAEAHAFAAGIDLVNDSSIRITDIATLPGGGSVVRLQDDDAEGSDVRVVIDTREGGP